MLVNQSNVWRIGKHKYVVEIKLLEDLFKDSFGVSAAVVVRQCRDSSTGFWIYESFLLYVIVHTIEHAAKFTYEHHRDAIHAVKDLLDVVFQFLPLPYPPMLGSNLFVVDANVVEHGRHRNM